MTDWTRRDFVKTSAATGLAAMVMPSFAAGWTRGGADTVRVGVIGCGGRGTGAAFNSLEAHPSTRIVALADLFPDRVENCLRELNDSEDFAGRVEVGERKFTGFDCYNQLLAQKDIDLVILATPPGFRPIHFEAAVNAGKHVFMEKPVAVDPPGVRKVIAAAEAAKAKRLSVVAGTQRRHEPCYLEAMKLLHDGQIGEIVSARCAWNQWGLWVHERQPNETDMEWQVRNWLYFCWTSGDHICEQHIHNLDVVNWAMGGHPTKAYGMGGRQVRTDAKYGHIFDHFAIEYEYEGGRQALSFCRQQDGTDGRVEETIYGTKGSLTTRPGFAVMEGQNPWRFSGNNGNPYALEHVSLLASVRGDAPYLNEGVRVAESTLTAIMGRMSAYTGKAVTWEQAMNSTLDLSPAKYEFGPLAMPAVPEPGKTPLI